MTVFEPGAAQEFRRARHLLYDPPEEEEIVFNKLSNICCEQPPLNSTHLQDHDGPSPAATTEVPSEIPQILDQDEEPPGWTHIVVNFAKLFISMSCNAKGFHGYTAKAIAAHCK